MALLSAGLELDMVDVDDDNVELAVDWNAALNRPFRPVFSGGTFTDIRTAARTFRCRNNISVSDNLFVIRAMRSFNVEWTSAGSITILCPGFRPR